MTELEIIKRKHIEANYLSGIPVPDEVWKEIYHIVDGKFEIKEIIKSEVILSHYVKEEIIFDK